jgi:Ca2+-binding RTX toxin-like protein
MKMKRLFALSALAVLGVVSYLVLAANVPCHLLNTQICNGTPGNDVITYISGFQTPGIGIINGKAGNDRILIDFRLTTRLTINGDEGNDTILDSDSDSGNGNSLWGGDGNDRIFGNGGDDYIDGGPGNDLIDGGPGKDTIIGGGGNDTFILRRGHAGGGTENIRCTTDRMDRGVIRLVGFSRQDLLLQGLQPGLLPSNNTVFEIRDGTTGKFNIDTGQGRCMLAVSAP